LFAKRAAGQQDTPNLVKQMEGKKIAPERRSGLLPSER
jgi:hypothetical protein